MARIVFVGNACHAMTSDRPYREPLTDEVARAELRGKAGSVGFVAALAGKKAPSSVRRTSGHCPDHRNERPLAMQHAHGSTPPSAASGHRATDTGTGTARRAEHQRHGAQAAAWSGSGRRALAVAAALLALCTLGAACGGTTAPRTSARPSPVKPVAQLFIRPAKGTTNVKPQGRIRVRVADGKIVGVTVRTTGDRVVGKLNSAATAWRSRPGLDVATRYTVHAIAIDAAGRTVAKTSTFRTLSPPQTFTAEIFEGHNETYGVGMPIILYFSRSITDRRAVERSLELSTSKRVVGAWYWDGDATLYFRPRSYWPVHTRVHLVAHLNGVEAAPGVYGTHTLRQSFVIGRSLIAVANTQSHQVRIYLNRKLFGDWPISSGRPGDDTPNGTYLTIDKGNPVEMKGTGYDIKVPWSVRFTWSGDYLHDAYWSVGEQGFANVSHGCVNLSPAHAETYYQMSVPGDPVTITGSPRGGAWDNGWTLWFLRWRDLLRGSALHKAVRAGPTGSVFVNPLKVRPSKAKAPLSAPWADNADAT
jgi:lipoprotein-anchoring transpeptidase ErfK/SrfK